MDTDCDPNNALGDEDQVEMRSTFGDVATDGYLKM